MYKKIFLNKLLEKLVAYIFKLLLVHFASKLINYSMRSESLNICKKSKSATFSFENNDLSMFKLSSKAHCAVTRITDQFGRKRYQKKRKDVSYHFL